MHDPIKFPWTKYSVENYENYPEKFVTLETYPLKEIDAMTGGRGCDSSIGYMVLHAIYERTLKSDVPIHIGLWGTDMSGDTEYKYQRDDLNWMLGLAHGKGVSVYLPEESKLFRKPRWYGIEFGGSEDWL